MLGLMLLTAKAGVLQPMRPGNVWMRSVDSSNRADWSPGESQPLAELSGLVRSDALSIAWPPAVWQGVRGKVVPVRELAQGVGVCGLKEGNPQGARVYHGDPQDVKRDFGKI